MATLREYFIRDFNRFLNVVQEHKAKDTLTGKEYSYPVRVHLDFDSGAKFVSIYIPLGLDPVGVANFYLQDISQALKIADTVEVHAGFGQLTHYVSSRELNFTGRLFIYTDNEIEQAKLNQLALRAKQHGINLVVRGKEYMDERNHFERPEAFISHDSRDKHVAEEIAVGLQKLMCSVWYDEYSLKVGDSLRKSIEKGIKESKVCILILSPHFLSNPGWTKAEFDSFYTREIIEKNNVILPIWHNVTKEQVYEYSPRLADRFAANTKDGIDEVVRKLHIAIKSRI